MLNNIEIFRNQLEFDKDRVEDLIHDFKMMIFVCGQNVIDGRPTLLTEERTEFIDFIDDNGFMVLKPFNMTHYVAYPKCKTK